MYLEKVYKNVVLDDDITNVQTNVIASDRNSNPLYFI